MKLESLNPSKFQKLNSDNMKFIVGGDVGETGAILIDCVRYSNDVQRASGTHWVEKTVGI